MRGHKVLAVDLFAGVDSFHVFSDQPVQPGVVLGSRFRMLRHECSHFKGRESREQPSTADWSSAERRAVVV
ncbi:MAG: hypothetical protein IH897_14110 [Planctomycetes bacterium]|nr:hypothetical protein [Planctomycetota bacterium]